MVIVMPAGAAMFFSFLFLVDNRAVSDVLNHHVTSFFIAVVATGVIRLHHPVSPHIDGVMFIHFVAHYVTCYTANRRADQNGFRIAANGLTDQGTTGNSYRRGARGVPCIGL